MDHWQLFSKIFSEHHPWYNFLLCRYCQKSFARNHQTVFEDNKALLRDSSEKTVNVGVGTIFQLL